MKTHNIVKKAVMAASIAAAFSTAMSYADVHPSADLIKVKPSAVYQAIRGKSLVDTLAQVAQRSGITFKVNTDLGKDVVSQSIAAENWDIAVRSLLVNYNFTAIQDKGAIKTVIISGRNNDGADTVTAKTITAAADDIIVIEPRLKTLPEKYKNFPAGSVTAVDLPVNTMMKVKDGSTIALDLPMGQFNVAHDHTVNEDDGSKTWVGHLSDEGEGYRVFLSQGAGGAMGIVTTPDGTYNIESDNTGTYLVDTSKLQHAGFDGDLATPSEAMMDAITMNATQAQIDQLQTAVNNAKKTLDAANALVAQYTSQLNSYQTQLKTVQATYNAAIVKRDTAQNAYNMAFAAYRARPSSANQAAVNASYVALIAAKNAYIVAFNANQTATNNVNAVNSRLTAAKAAAAKAQKNYDLAVKALSDAQATPVTPVASGTGTGATPAATDTPVVDLMVVYTTGAQTADYAKQRLTLLVTASNQAYVDSGINMKLRLVYTEPTAYVESNNNSQALSDLANDVGAFAGISQKRVQYGADLVFLFRPLYAQTAGSCGTTYVEFAQSSLANKWLGYGTVSDGSSKDALTGYYCGINTFTHEIGHSLGLVHDREYSSFTGVFNYSYAWGVQGTFGTIMSYKQPVLMYFSTPLLSTKCAGQPCGYAETDTARSSDQVKSVNYTAPQVANFMSTMVTTPVLK
ncbi:reprolysin-like metallopeptidase [Methylobacter sp.]|uniref:reprolysin-like metallopeptidase n=1 Tax=Methylobacter sp. TaxID=2051955 RepID=UPI002FDF8226